MRTEPCTRLAPCARFSGAPLPLPAGRVGPTPAHAPAGLIKVCTWPTVASGAVVFTEPAPYDVLMAGLVGLLVLTGRPRAAPLLGLYLMLWLACCAGASIAAMAANDVARASVHSLVSLYLCLSSFALAAYIAEDPLRRARLVLHAFLAAALLAAVAGIAGYFDAVPGGFELLTKFGRASGTFKDPNVFGAFLVPAMVYLVHVAVTRPMARAVPAAAALAVLALALLLSFSRGAWLNLSVALAVYGYLAFLTAACDRRRLRLAALYLLAGLFAAAFITTAVHIEAIASLLLERSELVHGYDIDRFDGQAKALRVALASPGGIGALQFAATYHHEDAHNVYLSMFLNAGWLGGLAYLSIVALSVGLGLRHALRRAAGGDLFLVAYAALLGCLFEGSVVDTDHWRHFYLLAAVVWGLMAAGPPSATPSAPPRREAHGHCASGPASL